MSYQNFFTRFGIEFNETEKEAQKRFQRIVLLELKHKNLNLAGFTLNKVCAINCFGGLKENKETQDFMNESKSHLILDCLRSENFIEEFLPTLEFLATQKIGIRDDYFQVRKKAEFAILIASSKVGDAAGVYWNEQEKKFYPAGAKELDQDLVSDVLKWLNKFPEAKRHYKSAWEEFLKFGDQQDQSKYGNILHKCRESFDNLVTVISNKNKFKKNEMLKMLNWQENDQTNKLTREIRAFIKEFGHPKKKDEPFFDLKKGDVEFFLYFTGMLLRLLIQNSQK